MQSQVNNKIPICNTISIGEPIAIVFCWPLRRLQPAEGPYSR
nr:MAG TPA: hypothetical protein [Caudoviricetes sp.]